MRNARQLGCLGLSLVLLGLSACAGTAPSTAPVAAHDGMNAILWVQTAAEYRAASLQAFGSARAHLQAAVDDPTWTAAPEQTGDFSALPTAIILDMDEAIIRSDRFQASLVASGGSYSLQAWNDWVRTETSEAMPGALAYVAAARKLGVYIFYVTNRTAEVEASSLATLRKLGFPVENGLADLLTQHEQEDWGSDKSSRRAVVASTHRILQIVGDNLNDFTSGAHTTVEARLALANRYADYWGSRWIVMPNPSYGGWEGAVFGYDYGLPPEEIHERKRQRLLPWR